MRFRWGASGALVLLQCVVLVRESDSVPPPAIRTTQVGAFRDRTEASVVERALTESGFSLVWIAEGDGTHRLNVGRCERHVDAFLLKQSLRKHGFSDAYEKAYRDLVTEDFETEAVTPDPPLVFAASQRLGHEGAVQASDPMLLRAVSYPNLQRMRQMEEALRGGTNAEAIDSARQWADSLPKSDPAKSWLMLRIGRAMVAAEYQDTSGSRPESLSPPQVSNAERRARLLEALDTILPVAQGEIAATADDRLEARWLAADIWHYHLVDFVKSYQAYDEIYDFYCGNKSRWHGKLGPDLTQTSPHQAPNWRR